MKTLMTLTLTGLLGTAVAAPLPLIPLPLKVDPGEGAFQFSAETVIRYEADYVSEAKLLAEDLTKLTGTRPKLVVAGLKFSAPSEIYLGSSHNDELSASGYELKVRPDDLVIRGKDAAGVYYGTRTLLQLLPAGKLAGISARIPAVTISDGPRFGWRGMMLDVGRHFQTVADVKRLIDWMAFHKLNVFHWHLTEDQGWRIEIKKYPKLTEVGSFRAASPPYGNRKGQDGVRYGGFYTQAEIKDVVAFAAERHITIVPEIEMPGHAAAAIAAYPELGNSDVAGYAPQVMTSWGVHPYTFAPKEETFHFLEDVLGEVCELFPSQFIHIGGDEAPKTQWKQSPGAQEVMQREGLKSEEELQSYFVRRIGKFLASKNRRLIGWDEIQEGGLPQTATMMVWRDVKWGKHALALGNDIVMATNSHLYFDHYQYPAAQELAKGKEYEAIGGLLPLEKVYAYDPAFVAENPAQAKQVLGTQAQLWTEYIQDMKKVEYMAFPRIAAFAEVAWTPPDLKNYENFRLRLEGVMEHYDAGKVNYPKPVPLTKP